MTIDEIIEDQIRAFDLFNPKVDVVYIDPINEPHLGVILNLRTVWNITHIPGQQPDILCALDAKRLLLPREDPIVLTMRPIVTRARFDSATSTFHFEAQSSIVQASECSPLIRAWVEGYRDSMTLEEFLKVSQS